jgi:thiosulfate/3-mercaptopyruvate sulfurtransferase
LQYFFTKIAKSMTQSSDFPVNPSADQGFGTDVVVSPQWLFTHQTDPSVTIVDCRFSLAEPSFGRGQYDAGHIPGAYYLDLNDDLSSPVTVHGGRHPLPDPVELAQKLTKMGVTAQSSVIAYDDSRFAYAARVWWLLRWLGHKRVAVLNGGLAAYQRAGYPLTQEIPTPRTGNFIPQVQAPQVVNKTTVDACKQLPTVALVDSREPARYRGEQEPIDPVAGHIPGAVNLPWQQVTDERGYLRSPTDLQAHWQAIADTPEIIVYCGSGVTACVNLLALTAAGITHGKLYAGSWSDWCSYL